MAAEVLVVFMTDDGEEREERWASLAAFLAWARGHGQRLRYTAYEADDDEWVVRERGTVG